MAGVLQPAVGSTDEPAAETKRTPTADEWIAIALEMCPPGQAIEIHAAYCDVIPCGCIPRVIVKPDVA